MADLAPDDRAFLEGLLHDPPSRAEVLADAMDDPSTVALYSAVQRARCDGDMAAALRVLARRKLEAGENVPGLLQRYAVRAWASPPRRKRGRRRQSARDMWAAAVYDLLRSEGWKARDARAFIAGGLGIGPDAVRSLLRGAPSRPGLRLG